MPTISDSFAHWIKQIPPGTKQATTSSPSKKPTRYKYAKLSLKPGEALVLLRFLDNIKTTREDWHQLDAIHSKLYKAYQKVKNEF